MSWIKEANKIGRYVTTYYGFRIYCIKEPQVLETIEEREDGKYRITNFIPGEYIAMNKELIQLTGTSRSGIAWEIDKRILIMSYERNESN